MTVPTSDNREEYTGNDATTSFDYAFKIFEDSDLQVYLQAADGTETLLVLNTDYSVSGAGDLTGGSVTYPLSGDPLASGEKLIILRVLDVVQETDLRNQGAYYPQVIEDEFDRSRMIDQQQQEELDRSLKQTEGGGDFDGRGFRILDILTSDNPGLGDVITYQFLQNFLSGIEAGSLGDASQVTALDTTDKRALNEWMKALLQRTIYVASVSDLEALPTAGFVDGQMFDVRGGQFKYVLATDSFEPVGAVPIDAFGTVVGDGVANDYATFDLAGEWLRLAPYRRVSLDGSKTYLLTYSGNLFFNGIEGNGASVIIGTGGFLHKARVTSVDEFYLDGLNIYKVGDRSGVLNTSGNDLYTDTYATPIKESVIRSVNVYGLTSAGDLTSWSDDAGETRFGTFMRILANSSTIESLTTYGIGLSAKVGYVADASHSESDVKGYNCETCVWVEGDAAAGEKYRYGKSENISIVNTEAQSLYWIGRDNGVNINGKDVLLQGGLHDEHWVSDIRDIFAIERSCYISGSGTTVSGVVQNSSGTGVNIKKEVTVIGDVVEGNSLRNSRLISSFETGAALHSFYGQKDLVVSDLFIKSDIERSTPAINPSKAIQGATFSDIEVENCGALVRSVINESLEVDDVRFSDIRLRNVFNGESNSGTVVDIKNTAYSNLVLENIRHAVTAPDTTKFARAAYHFDGIDGLELNNVQGWGKYYPFRTPNCTDVTVMDSEFFIASDVGIGAAINRLKTPAGMEANRFDFWVSIPINTEAEPTGVRIRFQGDYEGTKRDCWDHWTEMDIFVDAPANTAVSWSIPITDKSFDATISYLDSSLVISVDGETGGFTELRNRGTDLSTTDVLKYRIQTSGAGLFLRTDSTSLPGGQINMKIRR